MPLPHLQSFILANLLTPDPTFLCIYLGFSSSTFQYQSSSSTRLHPVVRLCLRIRAQTIKLNHEGLQECMASNFEDPIARVVGGKGRKCSLYTRTMLQFMEQMENKETLKSSMEASIILARLVYEHKYEAFLLRVKK
ncbi:hypothetical protein L2E82_12617 [Cichorium intybus]|uniref:Uncharacterized protein n=1 Tax=Cichorium intybus TaxID=13427 RepID=A0ACB9GHM8_CICIN|nr:hypothetical protein L2E82_12617 [Cichorium intybus]